MAERWWLVAGLRSTGSLDPDSKGEPRVLCEEAVRLTSLLGAREGGVKTGVVEPECDTAADSFEFEYEKAADAGREVGARLESREVDIVLDMLLDSRRIQLDGVPERRPPSDSRSAVLPLLAALCLL